MPSVLGFHGLFRATLQFVLHRMLKTFYDWSAWHGETLTASPELKSSPPCIAAADSTGSRVASKHHVEQQIGMVQKLPTSSWSEQDMESVLSRAYMWRASFNNARSHLTQG